MSSLGVEEASRERRTEVLRKSLGLSDKLAEFITQHYCPKTMESDISDTFYLLLASVMDVVVEGLSAVQALNSHGVLDTVKKAIVGELRGGEVELREYKMYMPTLSDIVAVLNLYYYSFVSTCLSEEYKLKFKAEKEKVEKKTGKKKKRG
jgi:hypothetical protein